MIGSIVEYRSSQGGQDKIAKDMAEFDYASIRRLERTRILVRVGPALGLMGTLIPLAPALAGLAEGDVQTLSDNLRVAFSVTVAGLLAGAIAFVISLVRDRLYGQDYSDLEYLATALAPGAVLPPAPAAPVAPAAAPTTAMPADSARPRRLRRPWRRRLPRSRRRRPKRSEHSRRSQPSHPRAPEPLQGDGKQARASA